jgi:SAM-dependent methyltransferase
MGSNSPRADPRPGLPKSLQREWRRNYASTPYRKLPWFSPFPYPWLRQAVEQRWYRPGTRVLDVGCGAGTNAMFLARNGFRASGVDLAPAAIAAAKSRADRRGLSVDFRVADALRLPYPRGFFGGLLDVGCFHTLPIKLRTAYSRELARVLRRRGHYIVSWVSRESAQPYGPPHRPSLEEAATAFEEEFLFLRTEFERPSGAPFSVYHALLERRTRPRPARR